MENSKNYKLQLDRILKERNISRHRLSVNTDINPNTIRKYCKEDCKAIKLDHLARICYVLDCKITDIISE